MVLKMGERYFRTNKPLVMGRSKRCRNWERDVGKMARPSRTDVTRFSSGTMSFASFSMGVPVRQSTCPADAYASYMVAHSVCQFSWTDRSRWRTTLCVSSRTRIEPLTLLANQAPFPPRNMSSISA